MGGKSASLPWIRGLTHDQWLKFLFLNVVVKIGVLVALYVWTIGLEGFFDTMIFTTLRPPEFAHSLRDLQPLPPIVS